MTSKGARMMRKGIMLIGSMAAIALVAGATWAATAAPTPSIPYPPKGAKLYKTYMVHAMEACDPLAVGAVTLHLKGLYNGKAGLIGCAPVVSDPVSGDTLRFGKAQVSINKKNGKIVFTAQGLGISQQVRLGLILRSSREDAVLWETGQTEVTYPDMSLICPVWTAYSSGKLNAVSHLDACGFAPGGPPLPAINLPQLDPISVGPPGGLEEKTPVLNIEVLDVVLIDVTTGEVFARAGIAR